VGDWVYSGSHGHKTTLEIASHSFKISGQPDNLFASSAHAPTLHWDHTLNGTGTWRVNAAGIGAGPTIELDINYDSAAPEYLAELQIEGSGPSSLAQYLGDPDNGQLFTLKRHK
jgi:hypothetical protein